MRKLHTVVSPLHQVLGLVVAALLAVMQVFSGIAMAQIQDTEDPVIIHRQADSPGVAGELQTFLARVYDDVEVVDVTLFYRQSAVANFQQIPMRPLLDSLGEYMIAIETSESEYPGLQYYIEAVDSSGNVTNRGFSYAPIVLPLETGVTPPVEQPTAPVIAESPQSTSGGSRGFANNGLLFGLGALVLLGALAAGGGGSDDGGGTNPNPNPNPTPGAVTLTIISDSPGGN